MSYNPGTHLIATLRTDDVSLLKQHHLFRSLADNFISEHGLQKLGEVYHDFSPAGFTAVICLSESHISIHTWPEHGRINIDIYLSNYLRENDGTVTSIYNKIKDHFIASVDEVQTIKR